MREKVEKGEEKRRRKKESKFLKRNLKSIVCHIR